MADTLVRGFGLRLWKTSNSSGVAFAIRVTDAHGRSVRKTYDPFKDYLSNPLRSWYFSERYMSPSGSIMLSAFLEPAREWAKVEIGRLKGRLPSEEEIRLAEVEYSSMRAKTRRYIEKKSLGELCEIILDERSRRARGWTEEYADRLRHAFDKFDSQVKIRDVTLGELSDGRLTELIEKSTISNGNLRNLRSLLNVVLWNVHEVGGPSIGKVFPGGRRYGLRTQPLPSVLDDFTKENFLEIIKGARELCLDWRASTCIELCFHFWAPITRIMSGRWSQIIENRWYPYSASERSSWYYRWSRIDGPEFACLKRAADEAEEEGLHSDFFFPSPVFPHEPVSNIDRAWFSLLSELELPRLSLKQCVTRYRQRYPFLTWPDPNESLRIAAKLSKIVTKRDLSN
ncbi:hypothetical protein [Nisaea denitrificans]|uniref:hypothetical protein n=1 Tax=Nisaea denitrificans TaxID=390877 RepID=UPI0012EBFDC6|nr:hypothetical protein [Nisaea denitrificans]